VAGEGRAEQASPVDQRVVRAALLDWMTSLRSITSDVYLQRRFIDDVYAKMVKSSAAFNVVSDSYKQNSPFEHGQNQTVSVDVHAITPLSPSSYEITWVETTRDRSGVLVGKQEWKGVVTYVVSPPSDEATIRRNPLGIYVTEFDWNKVL
jgi:type IV secretion system protein VirB5